MDSIVSLKNTCEDDFSVEFDVLPSMEISKSLDERQERIFRGLASVDEQLAETKAKIDKLNIEIDRLTNHADGIDYMIAVASGIIAGAIDSVWVGEFSIERANEWGDEKAKNFVVKIAQKQGYTGDDLEGAVKHLEDNYKLAADKATNDFGGGLQHHLRDFSHHPTPVGLFFSFLTQFTHKVYGTDVAGNFKVVELSQADLLLIGNSFPEKITFGVINWFFHMVSDMTGSSSSIHDGKKGTGLPGPIVSLLKEISALPIFCSMNENGYKEFSVWISKLFNGTLLGKRDENGKIIDAVKFDLRTEIGVAHELGRQAIPVIINECVVRGFYFIRRFYFELKDNHVKCFADLKKINIRNTLPFKNRTVVRMLTISSGTFTAIDMADAAIHSAAKSGGFTSPAFWSNMILRVNFVGVGRFAIAIGTDAGMGGKRSRARNERIHLYTEQIALTDAKVFYKQANMWIAAENAGETIEKAYKMMEKTTKFYIESMQEISDNLNKIGEYVPEIKKKNPTLINDINDILNWE